jgi:hypothetical protein
MKTLDYTLLLEKLRPYADSVAYIALTEAEIDELEKLAGHRFPDFYREYLNTFGLLQDFVFGLLQRPNDFKTQREYLPKEFWPEYIVVGDNGGEDCWLFRADATASYNQLYECQHWDNNQIVPLGFSFTDLLFNSLPEPDAVHLPNDQKAWCTQAMITTQDEEKLLAVLKAKTLSSWLYQDTSDAGVSKFYLDVQFPFGNHRLSKLTYRGWEAPLFSFSMRDAYPELQAGVSIIRETSQILRAAFGSAYKLADYGLLPADTAEE